MQIPLRDGDVVGERAVVVEDARARSDWGSAKARRPCRSGSAQQLQLISPTTRLPLNGPGLRDTDELVAEDAANPI